MNAPQLSRLKPVLGNRTVLITIMAGLVVILVWLLAFFVPQGKHLSRLTTQRQNLQGEEASLEAKLQLLRATSRATPQLLQLQAKFGAMIPATADMYNYISQMAGTAAQSGVGLVSMTPSSNGAPVSGTNLLSYPITVVVSGSYASTLNFMNALYAMPRLTVIDGVSISGGGPGSSKAAPLTSTFTLTVYSAAQASQATGSAR